jgi:hypothetical protein
MDGFSGLFLLSVKGVTDSYWESVLLGEVSDDGREPRLKATGGIDNR